LRLCNTSTVNIVTVKTTIILRDEIYTYLIERFGRRKMSETINRALMKYLFEPTESMFGVDPWLTTENLRDEEEPHEGS